MDSHANDLGRASQAFKESLSVIQANIEWMSKYASDVIETMQLFIEDPLPQQCISWIWMTAVIVSVLSQLTESCENDFRQLFHLARFDFLDYLFFTFKCTEFITIYFIAVQIKCGIMTIQSFSFR